jgi:hypothetical protein
MDRPPIKRPSAIAAALNRKPSGITREREKDMDSGMCQKVRNCSMDGQKKHLTSELLMRYSRNCAGNYRVLNENIGKEF